MSKEVNALSGLLMEHKQTVIVLDFGSQYTQLIARRIREQKVYSEILPWDTAPEQILARVPRGIVLSGGPASSLEPGAPAVAPEIVASGIPLLGICYGMQTLALALGGTVRKGERAEYGRTQVTRFGEHPLFEGVNRELSVWMSHWDQVDVVPPGTVLLAESEGGVPAAFATPDGRVSALQFHPEVVHTACGTAILANFLFKICGCLPDWNLDEWMRASMEAVRQTVKNGRVICGLSGGVDSSVAAMLVQKALGDGLTCIFVNNGLLRLGEAEEILKAYHGLGLDVRYVDASERFLDALTGVTEPEKKRKIIGEIFVRVFEEAAQATGGAQWLLQGTLYPDVIESGQKGRGAAVIKTHHNVGGLPEKMSLGLLEPLRDLFKDEVRIIGRLLQLPDAILGRHPFPGPGLGVRCLGDLSRDRLEVLRQADAIFLQALRDAGLYDQIWQAFAVLLPVRSVGVVGDVRTYGETVVLRAVEAQDGMTADWARLPYELLDCVGRRICNGIPGVSRVVYDVTGKPPATIEWE